MAVLRSALASLCSSIAGPRSRCFSPFPISLFGTRALRAWVTHFWARFHRLLARHLLGIRSRIEGAPPTGAALVAVKHQSMFETMEMIMLLDEPAVVMKRELTEIPLWGWVVRRYGIIPVDRAGGAQGAAGDAARGRGGERRGAADRHLSGRDARRRPASAAASAGLRRPLSRARPAGRAAWRWTAAGSGRRAASSSGRDRHLPLRARRSRPACPRAEIEAAVHAAINALEPMSSGAMTPELGIIEGFFGRPWSWAARREAVRFLRPHGFLFYLYAPKADAFLRRRWRDPYPEDELEALAAFAQACRAEGVRFGIGLTPFELHLHPDRSWREDLARKLAPARPAQARTISPSSSTT